MNKASAGQVSIAAIAFTLAALGCFPQVRRSDVAQLRDRAIDNENRCRATLEIPDAFGAFDACHGLITTDPAISRELNQKLESLFRRGADEAMRTGRADAERWVLYYSRVEGANADLAAEWRRQLDLRQHAAQQAAENAAEADRVAQRTRVFETDQAKQAVARLRSRYGWTMGMALAEFESTVALATSQVGVRDVKIEGKRMVLSVSSERSPALVGAGDDIITVVDAANAFIVWCGCDGITEVWAPVWFNGPSGRPVSRPIRFYRLGLNPTLGWADSY